MLRFLILGFLIVVFLAIRLGIGTKRNARDYIRSRPFNHKRHEQIADMLALLATEENREINDKTITMDEALSFVIGHSKFWNPANEFAAARRLIEAGITSAELDRMSQPGNAALQDRINGILYDGVEGD